MAKRRSQLLSATQVLVSLALISVCMFSTPALASSLAGTSTASAAPAPSSPGLQADATAVSKVPSPNEGTANFTVAQPKRPAPIPKPKATTTQTKVVAYSTTAKAPARTTTRVTTTAVKSTASEASRARTILASMIAQYPILAGTTVSFGTTPGGYQAVAYYKSGRILISTTHTASLDRIIRHECWHIIDWRDNGRIDWGENVPPK